MYANALMLDNRANGWHLFEPLKIRDKKKTHCERLFSIIIKTIINKIISTTILNHIKLSQALPRDACT